MRVGSLFAGVGGFDLAAEAAGMDVVWQSENDKAANRVLDSHWPNTNLGDIHGIESPPAVDVLCGGFPCQDYSVAGNREGLAGDRGALWWQFHRLADEIRPTWIAAENVPGLLSSGGGRDFATIIGSLVDLGYGVVWTVLDAQYFGLAQRRRRLFIIGHSGGEPRPEILALGEGLFGHPRPSRTSRPKTAAGSENGAPIPYRKATKDGWDKGFERWEQDDVTGTLNTQGDTAGTVVTTSAAIAAGEIARSLGAVGGGNDVGANKGTLVYRLEAMVRRLTPLECERLQGFPDDWTRIPGNTDSMRYRQMGNAVAVPVVEWIMRRIAKEER